MEAARALAQVMARNNIQLVYGGGTVGLSKPSLYFPLPPFSPLNLTLQLLSLFKKKEKTTSY